MRDLKIPILTKGLWTWSQSDIQDVLSSNETKLSIKINNLESLEFDLDELTFVCQSENSLDCELLSKIFLFRFKAGYFARKEDYNCGSITIEKVSVLHGQKRMAYEEACRNSIEIYKKFELACNDDFNELFAKYEEFDETRRQDRLKKYHEKLKKCENFPIICHSIQEQGLDTTQEVHEPIPIQIVEGVVTYPQRETDLSPSIAEISQFLKELNLLFPLDESNKTFCGIQETEMDLGSQRFFCFNLCHFLVLFGIFTGITYDYRLSICEGVWRIEDRVSGTDIKIDQMSKANIFDNPYRDAIVNCLKKLIEDLKIIPSNDIISSLKSLQNYYKTFI